MKYTWHNKIIEVFKNIYPNSNTMHFADNINKLVNESIIPNHYLVPDLYIIDNQIQLPLFDTYNKRIIVFEFVDTSDLKEKKKIKYADLWDILDQENIQLVVYRVDKSYNIYQLPLREYYFYYILFPEKYKTIDECMSDLQTEEIKWDEMSESDKDMQISNAAKLLDGYYMSIGWRRSRI